MAKRKAWLARRPIPTCELGILHAFGPGVLHAPNKLLMFAGSENRRLKIPLRGLRLVCVYGPVRVTAGAVRLITDAGAALAYFSQDGGRTNGVLQPTRDHWRGRRFRQYQASNCLNWTLEQARQIVHEKIDSMLVVARYLQRRGNSTCDVELLRDLNCHRQSAASATDHASLRGFEGIATRTWFEALAGSLPAGWTFPGRVKHPPTDSVNALLSLGYTILLHHVEAACQAWGLDPAVGVFHEFRSGRPSLACDLSEPFRTPVVERSLLTALHQGQFQSSDFQQNPDDLSVRLSEPAFRRWLTILETNLHDGQGKTQSLQLQIASRVGMLVDAIPDCAAPWPRATQSSAPLPE